MTQHIPLATSEPVVAALLAAYPKALKPTPPNMLPVSSGNTALHFAMRGNVSEAVANLVMKAWPAAARVKNNEGMTPLHLALMHKAPQAVVDALLAEFPGAVQEVDREHAAPLYLALIGNASEAVTLAVLAAWPEAASIRWNRFPSHSGGSTTLCHALAMKASEAVVAAILTACPYVSALYLLRFLVTRWYCSEHHCARQRR